MENEIKINEIEISKLNLQPGQILMVKIYVDDIDAASLSSLRIQLQSVFPDNKIMLFALPIGGKMDMDILDVGNLIQSGTSKSENKPQQSASNCSEPMSYCNDCSCGKKERIEGEK